MSVEIGRRVAEARKDKGWNQAELAEVLCRNNPDLETAASTISAIETGQSKRTTLLPEISEVLGVTLNRLKTGKAPKTHTNGLAGAIENIDHIKEVISASQEEIGFSKEIAAEIAQLLLDVVQDPGVGGEALTIRDRRMLSATLTRRFLREKRLKVEVIKN